MVLNNYLLEISVFSKQNLKALFHMRGQCHIFLPDVDQKLSEFHEHDNMPKNFNNDIFNML